MMDLELTGTRPPSAQSCRPLSRTSNRPKSGYRVVSDKSNVDELLFGSEHSKNENVINFKPPWANTPRSKNDSDGKKKSRMRPLFWAPEGRDIVTSQSEKRAYKGNSHSIDLDRLNRYRPVKQKPSFCDESLFGPRLEEPSFEAPWADKIKKPKPYLFSPVDYAQLTREGSASSAKYSSTGTLDGRPPSRQGRRPKTSSTRPVTVESAQDIHKPTWIP